MVSLGIVGILLAILLVLVSGVLDRQSEGPIVEIAPKVLFEQMVNKAIAEEAKTIHVEDFEVDAEMLERIRGMESVETLILDQGVVSNEMLDIVTSLPNLRHLRLRLSPIDDTGMKKLASCEALWFI